MGVLTDFVVANPGDAKRVGDSEYPAEEFNGVDAKGIDAVKLGSLYAILTRTDFDPGFMGDDDTYLYTAADDGPWVLLVSPDLVTRVAQIPESEITSITNKWINSEDCAPEFRDWSSSDVEQILRDLIMLSRKATDHGRCLLMWMCL